MPCNAWCGCFCFWPRTFDVHKAIYKIKLRSVAASWLFLFRQTYYKVVWAHGQASERVSAEEKLKLLENWCGHKSWITSGYGSTETENGRGGETLKISRNVKPTNVYFYFRDACAYTNVVEKQNTLAFTGHMWMVPLETTDPAVIVRFVATLYVHFGAVFARFILFSRCCCCYFLVAVSRIWTAVCYCLVFPNVRLSALHGHACTFALVFIYNYQ